MTVWKPKDCRTYRYRFHLRGQRFEGNTHLSNPTDAKEWEEREIRKRERDLAGLSVLPEHSPHFTDWAAVYYAYVTERGRVRRLDRIDELLRVVLRFWGAKPSGKNPKNQPIEGEPYHDLRLVDPMRDPSWILQFEAWMRARTVRAGGQGLSNQTKNHYRSIMSRMYDVAGLPQFSSKTGVPHDANPFRRLERDRTRGRRVTVTPAELRRWLAQTPKHAKLALAIASLAPKLRLENVLSLEWDRHVDADLTYITVHEHKMVDETGEPLVAPIVPQLRVILMAARQERRGRYVIMYRGDRVKSIRSAVKTGAEAAGLRYGRDVGGVTFHTVRHSMATLIATMPSITEALRASTMGQDVETTQHYTHLRPVHERRVVARLARVLQLEDLFVAADIEPAVPASRRAAKP